ncbi:MAG: dTDP-glucose 4,6-dehydratase [Pseudomonadota bacterium]
MKYTMKNVLVTGGAGFIGSNFIRCLLRLPQAPMVINLDLLTYAGSKKNLQALPKADQHHFVQGDICDGRCIDNLFRQYNIDTVVHFAAESHVDRSISGPAPFIQTNVVGTFTLLEAARQYWLGEKKYNQQQCRFHHISTDEVYGSLNKEDPAFTEHTAYTPNSPYSASKAGSDHLARAYYHTYKLPVTISNCSNNYGPYQHPEKFIPTIIRSCLNNQCIPVYGDGSNIRDWLYVDDHCQAVINIISAGKVGETYNIGGNSEYSNLDVTGRICKLLDELKPKQNSYREQIRFVDDRLGHDWRYAINHDKISQTLNWQPLEDFDSGLRKTIAFYDM